MGYLGTKPNVATTLPDSIVTSDKINDGAVGTNDLANGAVTQSKLGAGVVGTGPAFRAFKNAAQTISSNTFTKVTLPAEAFDTASAFDSSTNHRFQPTIPGYYQLNAKLNVDSTAALVRVILSIRLNGTESNSYGRGIDINPGNNFVILSVSELFYMNGTTDYAEMWVWAASTGTLNVQSADANTTVLTGFLARAA